jgi:hypothetical protein
LKIHKKQKIHQKVDTGVEHEPRFERDRFHVRYQTALFANYNKVEDTDSPGQGERRKDQQRGPHQFQFGLHAATIDALLGAPPMHFAYFAAKF